MIVLRILELHSPLHTTHSCYTPTTFSSRYHCSLPCPFFFGLDQGPPCRNCSINAQIYINPYRGPPLSDLNPLGPASSYICTRLGTQRNRCAEKGASRFGKVGDAEAAERLHGCFRHVVTRTYEPGGRVDSMNSIYDPASAFRGLS